MARARYQVADLEIVFLWYFEESIHALDCRHKATYNAASNSSDYAHIVCRCAGMCGK